MKWIDYKKKKPELFLKVLVAYRLESGEYHRIIGTRQYSGMMDMLAHPIMSLKIFWQPLPKPPKN